MSHEGKVQLTFVITCPQEHVAEGKRLFSTHGPWMKKTHHRDGKAALLSYSVAIGPELPNPMDMDSTPTGRTAFILNETYESEDGVRDHFQQASSWADFPALGAWLAHCDVTAIPAAKIVNSLW